MGMKKGNKLGFLLAAAVVGSASAQSISPACNTYLQQLDNDNTLSQCATPLLEATAHFNPTLTGSSDAASNSSVQDTLAMICSSATQFCSNSLLQVTLNQFFSSCGAEMGGSTAVPAVQSLYDSLYMLPAFKTAVCATDATTQQSCLLQMGTSSATVPVGEDSPQSGSAAAVPVHEAAANATVNLAQEAAPSIGAANSTDSLGVANVTDMRVGVVALAMKSSSSYDISAIAGSVLNAPSLLYQAASGIKQAARRRLVRRQEYTSDGTPIPSSTPSANTTDAATLIDSAIVPNTTTFTDSYLHFLFLNPDMATSQLCTPCTQQILASYVSWEGMQPYPIGISNSGMLGVQIKLYRAVATRCGAGFAQHINVIAGQKTLQGSAMTIKNSAWSVAVGLILWLSL